VSTAAALALLTVDAGAELAPPPVPPLPPPPPVQVPTVPQLPSLPPTPTLPSLPTTPTPTTPRPPVQPPTPTVPLPVEEPGVQARGGSYGSSARAGSGYAGASASGSPSYTSSSSAPGRAKIVRLSSSRQWISRSGPRVRRQTTLSFVLSRPAVVEFIILRIAPDCRTVGRFRVPGRAGLNRVRFRGRLNGRPLAPGTYRIRARALRGGRALAETRIVIFRSTPLPAELAAARASDTCRGAVRGGDDSAAIAGPARPGTSAGGGAGPDVLRVQGNEALRTADDRARDRDFPVGVLGARFSRAADAVKQVHPILYVVLGLAIALLGLASLPVRYAPNARIAALLAYRRHAVALAGTAALITVTVFYALA
jgi:hypothetical protein